MKMGARIGRNRWSSCRHFLPVIFLSACFPPALVRLVSRGWPLRQAGSSLRQAQGGRFDRLSAGMLTAGATPEAGKPRPTGPFVFFVAFCAYFPAILLPRFGPLCNP